MKHTMQYAIKYTIPVMVGYIVLGISFGIMMIGLDFQWWVPILMSLVIFAGAMQFATVELLMAPFNPVAAASLALLVNARMLFYGLSMLETYTVSGLKKIYLAFGMSDETFALNVGLNVPEPLDPIQVYLSITGLNHSYWVLGTILGVVAGQLLPINYAGIEFSLTALFIINFFEQMLTTQDYFSGGVGVIVTLISLIVFGVDQFMIPAMIGMIIIFAIRFKTQQEVA